MAAQTIEAIFYRGDSQERVDHTPSGAALVSGEVINLGSGFTGVVTSPEGIADGALGSVATAGTFKVSKDDGAAVTFAVGAVVEWDDVGKLAVAAAAGTWKMGICEEAAGATDDHVKVALNRDVVD